MAGQRLTWLRRRRNESPPAEAVTEEGAVTKDGAEPPLPPGPSSLPKDPPPVQPEDRGRTLRLAGWLAVIVLAVVVAVGISWASGPPTEAELREQAGLIGKQELRIGVKDDVPGIAEINKETGRFEGFDIDIAYLVAAELGFAPDQVKFLPIETEDRIKMQARDDSGRFVTVDLVVATFSITPERLEQATMSQPYLLTEQSVVTRADHSRVTSLGDLEGEEVCTLGTSTSENAAAKAGAHLTGKNRISQCIEGLRDKKFDAVTTDAAILAGFVARYPDELRIHDIGLETSERWGISTGDNQALGTLVDLALYRSYADPADRRWEEAFDKYLAPLQKKLDELGELTDAGDEQPVAISAQPRVKEPDVRRWPWDRGGF